MNDISHRIRELREKKNLSRAKLADEIGETEDKIQSIEYSRQRITIDIIVKLTKLFGVSYNYLVEGKENKTTAQAESTTWNEPLASKSPNGEELIEIPQLDVSFSAGHGSYPDDHTLAIGSRPFNGKWIKNKGLKPEHLALVRVHGDSMEPLLKDKDMVMLDQSVNTPITTMPIAFRLDGELYIKLCKNDGKGNLEMISVNKVYNSIIIDRENPPHDFAIIAAVVWHAHSWI